jgi:MFS transporter, PAT family, beta-lactamase induction signal transducer AmpG
MGRRRAWLILAQVLMSAGFITAAVLAPGPQDIDVLLVVTFLVMAGSATQDVAVDGLAVDILPEKEQGTASAWMFGGQATGAAISGAAAAYGLQNLGSATTFLYYIPVLLIPTIYAVIMRERPGEKRFPWSHGEVARENKERVVEDWIAIFKITIKSLFKGPSLIFIVAQSLMRTGAGMTVPLWPLLATTFIGWDETQYGNTTSTIDLIMAVLAIGLGSYLTARFGGRRATVAVCLIHVGMLIYLAFGQDTWSVTNVFIAVYVVFSMLSLLSSICTNPLRMQLSDKRVSASQFTIYNSISNFPISVGASLFAIMGGIDNLTQTLLVCCGFFTVAGVVFAILRMPPTQEEHEAGLAHVFDDGIEPRIP